jgi:hypothetical protein
MDPLRILCVHRPHPQRLDACDVTGLWAERGGGLGCRDLNNNGGYLNNNNGLTGTLPTELGTMDALTNLCVHRPHPPRLDALRRHRVVG